MSYGDAMAMIDDITQKVRDLKQALAQETDPLRKQRMMVQFCSWLYTTCGYDIPGLPGFLERFLIKQLASRIASRMFPDA